MANKFDIRTRLGGIIPQGSDIRDYKLALAPPGSLPKTVNLEMYLPVHFDQRDTSSCVGNALSAAIIVSYMRAGKACSSPDTRPMIPSRLFLYYNARAAAGHSATDDGCVIRDAAKQAEKKGVCSEVTWPFDTDKVTVTPPPPAYAEALGHKLKQYQAVEISLYGLKSALAAGYAIVVGVSLYESFEYVSYKRPKMRIPKPAEKLIGRHAICLIGYDDRRKAFLVRNSWALSGNFYLPYDYIKFNGGKEVFDAWAIETAS